MSIHVALNHVTHYRYDRRVALGPQIVRLRPAPHSRTRILSYSMRVAPAKHFVNWQQDSQANYLARLVFPEKTEELRIEVDVVAEMAVLNPFDFFLEPHAEQYPFDYGPAEHSELAPYRLRMESTPRFAAYLAAISREKMRTIDFLVGLNQRVANDLKYLIRMEPGVQTPEQTLELRSGSCRDFTWLLVQLLRHLGFAARFTSGYLIQLTADVKSLDGPSGPAQDFTDLHAWCEVYLPGAGWIGLDSTSGLLAGEGHIPLACTAEPSSAAPVTGELEECETEFSHEMSVARVWEAPRVTKPYTEDQWAAIETLGHHVDRELEAAGVKLTMGGEPTFVSLDDRDGAEWNTTALGPTKRVIAGELFHRLRDYYAPQGLAHFGQGKWYPGEQLPRWSLNCFWRRDGEALWKERELIADERANHGVDERAAAQFLSELALRLGIESSAVFPAFEDLFYYMWRERRLPSNLEPSDPRLQDPLLRDRLMRILTRGLDKAAGSVLPLERDEDGQWIAGPWFLRAEHCYLIPGDSPLGYRLPLDAHPWVAESDHPYIHPIDPFAPKPPLPAQGEVARQLRHRMAAVGTAAEQRIAARARQPQTNESASWIVRPAMCTEVRNGVLYVFMPPTRNLLDYLELVTAVEQTAQMLKQPVIIEGYEPPKDTRLKYFRVTPDPGVIEVNIHPAEDWNELVDRTTHLYEAARLTRLSTEKFMLDGRHTGTGGGNHFVLGAADPAESPFLQRPDLLRSLISYWHNHPSLSYLFSGLFIGPTSQAPRLDEARNDSLYEIELAFKQFPKPNESVSPWLIDRLLRNLLIDVTGNTHRAEFCIDKLYSPDGPTGRLGLVEMRAFEMPPHARMSLAQQLLLRALLAKFAHTPYAPPRLARWGTELHDRFMLPYFIERDFRDVLDELETSGHALEREWFDPHFEFRFPKLGDIAVAGAEIELRQALEPWHVLGEEGGAGSTVRYVDSSVERVQVHVTGLAPDRYVMTCNRRSIPLRSSGNVGEFVAGVRYRAWQPSAALHPTIGIHSPLTFDLVDTWTGRSVGACQYHVVHPGGRSYDTFPVNAFEAESRRLARFFRIGHTPGPMQVPPVEMNQDFPFTLDLRNCG